MPKFKKAGSSPLLKKTVSWTTPSDVKEAIKPSNTTCGCGIDCDYGYLSLINFSAGCEKESSAIFISDGQINIGSFSDVKEAVGTCCSGTAPSNPCADCEDFINGVCTPRCSSSQKCENGQCVALCPDCEDFINGVCTPRCVGCLTCGAGGLCVTDTTKCLDVWDEVGFYDGTRTCVKDRDCGFGYSCFRQNPNDIFGICTKDPDVPMVCSGNNGSCAEGLCDAYDSTKRVIRSSVEDPNTFISCVECLSQNQCRTKYGGSLSDWICDSSNRCVPDPAGTNPSARCQAIYGTTSPTFYDTTLQRCVVDPNA